MIKRLKIYYLLSKTAPIRPISGDSIAEISIIKALSKKYDVYYNGEYFNPILGNYGLTKDYIKSPTNDYDLYIVRNNPEIFKKLPNPKIYFATPFEQECFKESDALYTFTDSWTEGLKSGYDFPYNAYPEGYKTNKAITINQVVDDIFRNKKNHYKTKKIRKDMGGQFIIGHFGRIANSCYPYSFLVVLKKLKKKYPRLNVVFCGNKKPVIEFGKKHNIKVMNFRYSDMPYAISACDLILYNYRDGQGHIAGSMKVLEAMACGVPILCPRYDARIEELGSDYELFYQYEDICPTNAEPKQDRFSVKVEREMIKLIERSIKDPQWLDDIGYKISKRAKYYSIDESSERLKKTIDKVIESSKNG